MTAFASFDYYQSIYLGFAFTTSENFAHYERKAEAKINQYTYGRITDDYLEDKGIDFFEQNSISDCTCALVDYLYKQESYENGISGSGNIASESLGNRSISYRDTTSATARAQQDKDVQGIIRLYLGNTGLMYAGLTWN